MKFISRLKVEEFCYQYGNPENYPVYFDKILLNASQVTNPSIDPLREPLKPGLFGSKTR